MFRFSRIVPKSSVNFVLSRTNSSVKPMMTIQGNKSLWKIYDQKVPDSTMISLKQNGKEINCWRKEENKKDFLFMINDGDAKYYFYENKFNECLVQNEDEKISKLYYEKRDSILVYLIVQGGCLSFFGAFCYWMLNL